MDIDNFMELFNSSTEDGDGIETAKERVRQSLEASTLYYYDISGDGTTYRRSGTRNGIGCASCTITLSQDGLATVRATSLMVPKGQERSMRKLCGFWNNSFKLRGLKIESGMVVFETAPFDPVSGNLDADMACSLALSVLHHYASATLALESGAQPWDLLDLYEDGRGDGGDGGASVPSLEEVRNLLQGMRDVPKKQTV